ncbi:MAG: V-type ATP synthase subunit F [Acidilobaceae archaeon]|nr:V-type ATP synthase subunit F [Acidilobaceae archaeon]MCX8166091.1 V-type ATP synthase subunit F [Acidilobaceae archaeon]MDW7974734.1 V-type ATP synthase subunit F [Sulfolobales archaeon]
MSKFERGKVAVLGDRETLPLFKSAGFKTVEVLSQSQVVEAVNRLNAEGDISLIIVLKHVLSDEARFKQQVASSRVPVFVLPTLYTKGEAVDVNKILAKALGMG